MKKTIKAIITTLALTALLSGTAYAKEGFSLAGFWKDDTSRSGGALEIGFPNLFETQDFFVRENLEIEGAGLMTEQSPAGVTMFTEKVSFGGKKTVNGIYIKSYAFSYAGAALFFLSGANKVKMDTGFDFGGGGGFEIGFENGNAGFVVEFGGGWCMIPSSIGSIKQSTPSFGYNNLTLGYRQYF